MSDQTEPWAPRYPRDLHTHRKQRRVTRRQVQAAIEVYRPIRRDLLEPSVPDRAPISGQS